MHTRERERGREGNRGGDATKMQIG